MRRIAVVLALTLGAGSALAADNVNVTAGSGTVAATKDIGGGVQAPKVVIIDPNGNLMSTNQGLQVFVPGGITPNGTWPVNVNNGVTLGFNGNIAVVAAGASAYGSALAVAGGITPGYGILGGAPAVSTNGPLSDPILAAVTTPGTNAGANWRNVVAGGLQVPSMTSGGALYTTLASGVSLTYTTRQNASGVAYAVAVTGASGARTLQNLVVSNPTTHSYIGLKLYDTAAPTQPTCSSATNLAAFFHVPASTTSGAVWNLPYPIEFTNGIGFCVIGLPSGNIPGNWLPTSSNGFGGVAEGNGINLNGTFR